MRSRPSARSSPPTSPPAPSRPAASPPPTQARPSWSAGGGWPRGNGEGAAPVARGRRRRHKGAAMIARPRIAPRRRASGRGGGRDRRGSLMSPSQAPLRAPLLRRTVLCLAATLVTAACSRGILDPVGPVGRDDSRILIDATLIMLAIVIPTILLAFWMAWRYRASNTKAEYLPYWSYSGRIEAVARSIPILTIMFIGGGVGVGSLPPRPGPPPGGQRPRRGGPGLPPALEM